MFKRRTLALAFVGLLAGVLAVSAVSAQGGRGDSGRGRPGDMGRGMMDRFEGMRERFGDAFGMGMMGHREGMGVFGDMLGRGMLGGFGSNMSSFLQDATGLTAAELREALANGQTLAALIEANGKTVDEVRAEALAAVEEALATAVENGRIVEEQAALMRSRAETMIDEALTRDFSARRQAWPAMRGPWGGLLSDVAQATGLDLASIVEQVQAGTTLAEILAENGVDVATFTNDYLADVEAQLVDAVSSGRMSQSVADAWLNLRRAQIEDQLNRLPSTIAPADAEGQSS